MKRRLNRIEFRAKKWNFSNFYRILYGVLCGYAYFDTGDGSTQPRVLARRLFKYESECDLRVSISTVLGSIFYGTIFGIKDKDRNRG